jgi:hypothetical protein
MKKSMILLFIAGILVMLLFVAGCQQTPNSISEIGKDGKKTLEVVIDPKEVTLPPDGFQLFKATITGITDKTVKWSIQEVPDGGTIDENSGLYTAPLASGDYHVVATSNGDPLKKDTALVHVDINASGNPYYTGTIVLEITGTYIAPNGGGTYTYDDKETLYVMLDYDSSIGTPPTDTRWYNYIGNHTIINVIGKIYEEMRDSKGNLVYYITTNGFQSFTTTQKVNLGLNKGVNMLYFDIYSIKYDNAQMIQGGKVILTGYPMAGASIEDPLPIDLYHLSGTAMQSGLPANMQTKVTWDLKRTF